MSYSEKLIEFVKLKGKEILRLTNIKYVNDEDITDLREWSEVICKEVYLQLKDEIINEGVRGLNKFTCPWCVLYEDNVDCLGCGYGKRHRMCYLVTSLYSSYEHGGKYTSNNMYKDILKKVENM